MSDVKCPKCGERINVGLMLGSIKTAAKAQAARENGKLGGRPKHAAKTKRKKGSKTGMFHVAK